MRAPVGERPCGQVINGLNYPVVYGTVGQTRMARRPDSTAVEFQRKPA